MRMKLYFELENDVLPIQYRKSILSFIKSALSEHDEQDFERFYHANDNIIKPYTFSVFFYKPEFKKEEIIVPSKKFELNMSIAEERVTVILYNAFNEKRDKKFSLYKNSMILREIQFMTEKEVKNDYANIKFMSPLVVRQRNRETKKDYYYSFLHKEFEEMLKVNIKEQLKICNLPLDLVDNFTIQAIQPKKTVIKFYEKQIEASLGEYIIKGNRELLNYLYKAGMGSKHSAGFGMFEIA